MQRDMRRIDSLQCTCPSRTLTFDFLRELQVNHATDVGGLETTREGLHTLTSSQVI